MQAVLAFLSAHAGYVSIGALMLSVFCAGSMLKGEQVRKEEIRDQLREIEEMTETTMTRVQQITSTLEAEDRRLVGEIGKTYAELAAITAEESAARQALAARQQQINRPRTPARPPAGPAFTGFTLRNN